MNTKVTKTIRQLATGVLRQSKINQCRPRAAFMLLMMILFGSHLLAADYDLEVDGVYYTYDTDNLIATVVSAPYDAPYSGDVIIPVSFTRGRFTFDVTKVAEQAFANSQVTSVKFLTSDGKGVKTIGKYAFAHCKQLVEVELPNTLTSLGAFAFYNCTALPVVTVPPGVEAINRCAFSGCSALETVNLPEIMDPMSIDELAFSSSGIITITLPKGVQATGKECFSGCKRLTTVNFPDDWIYINSEMFTDCKSLTSITFPHSLKGILTCAFEGCPLQSVTIPASVEFIDWSAFTSCSQLKDLVFEDSEEAISVMEYGVDEDELVGLNTLYCGRDFTDVYDDFCPPVLKEMTIGPFVTSLPFTFGNSLEKIHSRIMSPATVKEKFTSKVKSNATLYVPSGTLDAYYNAEGWKKFFFIEEEGGGEPVITVTADDKTVEYGEEIPAFTYTVSGGTLNGEPDISTVARRYSEVGTYPISMAMGTITNKWVYLVNGTLTITKAPLTVGVQNVTITEGDPIPSFTLTYSGFKGTQDESVLTTLPTASTTATTSSPAGTYPITISGGSATNYSFSYTSGTLTIKKKVVGTTIPGYRLNETDLTAVVIALENGQYEGDVFVPETVVHDNKTYRVVGVDDEAFKGSSVTRVKLPYGVTQIGSEAFADCAHLTHVTLPATLQSIGARAFYGANVLKYIQTFMTAPIAIGELTFSDWTYAHAAVFVPYSTGYALRKEYEAADEWKKFGSIVTTDDDPYLMTDIPNQQGIMLNIYITDEVNRIARLGTGISKMTAVESSTEGEVIIPQTLGGYTITSIYNGAFFDCRELTAVTIPQSVTAIEWMAFYQCFGLTDVTVLSETPYPFENADYAFPANVYTNATLHVPAGTYSAYKACDGWKEFKIIEEMPDAGLLGDVNADGTVGIGDIVAVTNVMAGITTDAAVISRADVNGDGSVGIGDIVAITNIMAGIEVYADLALESTAPISLKAGQFTGVNIISGSGSYTATSSNANVVMADISDWTSVTTQEKGKCVNIKATGVGMATVTVSDSKSGQRVTLSVSVTENIKLLELSTYALDLKVGESGVVVITSSSDGQLLIATTDASVATFTVEDYTIIVKAIGAGNCGITVNDSQTGEVARVEVTVTEPAPPAGVKAVDLGLPSGTLWANMNVGATSPQENGLYFAWGETTGYTGDASDGRSFDWASYKWMTPGQSDSKYINKYQTPDGTTDACWYQFNWDIVDYEFIGDALTELLPEDDAAHANWGGDWYMPTKEAFQELLDNTTFEWITVGAVSGARLTSKINGNVIFLPAAGLSINGVLNDVGKCGYFWSSTLNGSNTNFATNLYFFSGNADLRSNFRYRGLTVRPVLPGKRTPDNVEAVDLGLPSGTKWANMNIGASSPEDYGDYFAWGETEPKDTYDWSAYTHCDGSEETCHDIGTYIAGTEYDAATAQWGKSWHMPTLEQINELVNYCTSEWTTQNGVNGQKFTSKVNGKAIFLPAAGFRWDGELFDAGSDGLYWSSTLLASGPNFACGLRFRSDCFWGGSNYEGRYHGLSVRPVR